MIKNIYLFLLVLIISCNTGDKDFQPLKKYQVSKGLTSTYLVEETKFVNNKATTNSYYLKEIVGDSILFNGEVSYVLQRYKKSLTGGDFVRLNNWQIKQNEFFLTRYEDNREFAALAYPITNIQKWLAYPLEETLGQYEVHYEDLNTTYALNNSTYNNVYKVVYNEKPDNIVDYINSVAYYSGSQGLIYSESIYYEYSQNPDKIGTGFIINGTTIKKTLIE